MFLTHELQCFLMCLGGEKGSRCTHSILIRDARIGGEKGTPCNHSTDAN